MAGTFSVENKVLPGAYVKTKSESMNVNLAAERGIVALPLELNFGEVNKVIEVDSTSNFQKLFGYDITAPELLLLKEALKKAKKVLVYRLNAGTKASALVNLAEEGETPVELTITAKHDGVRGNDISVKIVANVDTNDYTVETYLAGYKVDSFVASTIADLVSNDYVTFSGEGEEGLRAFAGVTLEGGTNQTVTGNDYTNFLTAIEKYKFNVLGITAEDVSSIKSVLKTFVQRLRDEGKYIQLVISNYANADYEGVISVKNGVVLDDGTTINAAKACAYIAGMMASSDVNKSNTYEAYDEAIRVDTVYTTSELEEAIKNGELVFIEKNDRVVILQDINTLITYTPEKNEYFHKNRVLRCVDTLQEEVTLLFEDHYVGKVNNDEDGRTLFKSAVIKLINDNYIQKGAIRDFQNDDVIIEAGDEIDTIRAKIGIYPIDSMEKLYATITLKGGNE